MWVALERGIGQIRPMLSTLAMPVLRRMDPERAHGLALRAVALHPGKAPPDDPRVATPFCGRMLGNPIGLAAGFDKDAVALHGLLALGFGFVEAGTVTRLAQPGNARPRLFRLTEDRAIINRMGFNNAGIAAFAVRLGREPAGTVGVNIGLNKTGADPERDYPALVAAVADRAAYVAINVSSPNTPGLRDLQAPARLMAILGAVRSAVSRPPALFVKLAPDLDDAALPDIVESCRAAGASGLIVCNTTLARPALASRHAGEAGGLSGAPLAARAAAMLERVAALAGGQLALIGVGGIRTGSDILARLRAGADVVQVYTAFTLEGPGLVIRLKQQLLAAMDAAGIADLASLRRT